MLVHRLLHAYGHACVHAYAHGDVLLYARGCVHDHVLHHNPSHHDDRDDHDLYGRDRQCISIISYERDDVD